MPRIEPAAEPINRRKLIRCNLTSNMKTESENASPIPAPTHFEERFRIPGRDPAIRGQALGIGSRRRAASLPGGFVLPGQFRGIRVDRQEVFRLKLRIVRKDLFRRGANGQPLEKFLNRDAMAADAGLPKRTFGSIVTRSSRDA